MQHWNVPLFYLGVNYERDNVLVQTYDNTLSNSMINHCLNTCISSVVIVVFDLSDEASIAGISRWMHDASGATTDPIKFVVGTKRDLVVSSMRSNRNQLQILSF